MGKVDVVIVTGLGRLAHNEAALTDLARTLSQHKVDLIAGEDR
jgi:DNA invertase Pin-like site-specific DNA recombinase